ncbi:TRAP transporter small permease subunit [Ruegeria arenilitoris]|uniref:TRAP transporter small permease subunit n=1 Tax=Ruegeria arenilitoris TaxID=1173585 RepID=UPI0014800099|nr:TRAP transporter small permease subunit [Ruegeria arenilitoris]
MKTLDTLSELFGQIAAWLLVPLVAIMCFEVFCRYVLAAPTTWSYEFSYMLTAANYLLAFAMVLRHDANMRVDILYNTLPVRFRAAVDLFFLVVVLCPFLYLILPALFHHMARAWTTGELTGQSSWNPPVWPFRLIYVLSFALLGLQVLSEILRKVRITLNLNPSQEERVQ